MIKKYFRRSRKAEFNQRNKLTRNEKLTLALASAALLISLGQIIFTSQFFTDLFIKPKIYASAKNYSVENGKVISTFEIKNKGNKTAEDLIVSMTCFKNDTYTIYPINILDTSEQKNGEPLKDIIIKSGAFVPNDFIFIQIVTDTATFNSAKKQLINQKIRPSAFIIPNLNFVKFKNGIVEIDRYVKE